MAGNWKLFKTQAQTRDFFGALVSSIADVEHCDVVVAPPYTSLVAAVDATRGSQVSIAAQDVYWESEGAFTGEVSAPMLADVGCDYAIIGHSERRQYFGETDLTVSRKIRAVLRAGLKAIVCVGETLDQRDGGGAEAVVQRQLTGGLAELTGPDLSHIIVAYEPVWAIGTGKVATPDQAESAHAHLRSRLAARYNAEVGDCVRILYGGSVKAENAAELLGQPNIDGALVGGASLKAEAFLPIVEAAKACVG